MLKDMQFENNDVTCIAQILNVRKYNFIVDATTSSINKR